MLLKSLLCAAIIGSASLNICACAATHSKAPKGKQKKMRIYIGTYTQDGSKGIYTSMLDMETGALTKPTLAAETASPSFIVANHSHEFIYAANEVGQFAGKPTGSITAFRREDDGTLKQLNQVSSEGGGPCHLALDPTGKTLFVANYGTGSIASYSLHADGSLSVAKTVSQHDGTGPDKSRQEGPHAHSVGTDPSGLHLYSCDLGTDKIMIYDFDKVDSSFKPAVNPSGDALPGSGPRHIVFHPAGNLAFVIDEMTSVLESFTVDSTSGALAEVSHVSTIPAGFKGNNSTAEIHILKSGKFLYGSNRGHDSVVVYSIDQVTGALTPVQHQKTGGIMPRSFEFDPSEKFLLAAHQISGNITVFKVNHATGKLTPTGHEIKLPHPVSIAFTP